MDAFYETSLTKGIIGLMELYINTKRERERDMTNRRGWKSDVQIKNFSCNRRSSLILNERRGR